MGNYIDYTIDSYRREIQRIVLHKQYPISKNRKWAYLHCEYEGRGVSAGIQPDEEDNNSLVGFKDELGNIVNEIPLADYNNDKLELWFDPRIITDGPVDLNLTTITLLVTVALVDKDEYTHNIDTIEVEVNLFIHEVKFRFLNIEYDKPDRCYYHLNNEKTKVCTVAVGCERFDIEKFQKPKLKPSNHYLSIEEHVSNSNERQNEFKFDVFIKNQLLNNEVPELFSRENHREVSEKIILSNTDEDISELLSFTLLKYYPKISLSYLPIHSEIKYQMQEILIGQLKLWVDAEENFFPEVLNLSVLNIQSPILLKEDCIKFNSNAKKRDLDVYFDGNKAINPINEYDDFGIIDGNNLKVFRNDEKTCCSYKFTKPDGTIIDRDYDFGEISLIQHHKSHRSITLCHVEIGNNCNFTSDGKLMFTHPVIQPVADCVIDVRSDCDNQCFIIRNGDRNMRKFDINIDIEQAKAHINEKIEFDVLFKYIEDHGNKQDADRVDFNYYGTEFRRKFTVSIQPTPCRNWICVDNGTSAIVVAKRENKEDSIINLNEKQISLYSKTDSADIFESGTNHITSMFQFKSGKELSSKKPLECFYRFSPTISETNAAPQYISPPIKIIIGHDNIYDRLLCVDPSKIINYKDNETKPADNSILSSEKVMEESYKQLLTHYLPAGEFNYIFTYPNNFSRYHVNKIKGYFYTHSPDSKVFDISESDAALLSYINSQQFTGASGDISYILIYDMGAGTLDITYAKITINDNKREIEILGKTGCNLGGNYLDYIIAKILCRENPNELSADDFLYKSGAKSFELKKTIANEIKPMLSQDADIVVKIDNKDITIKPSEILLDDTVQDYLNDCTVEIINDFKSFLPNGMLEKINILVLSGRATKFKPIVPKLEKIFNSSTGMNINTIESNSKEIVANGALRYATLYLNNKAVNFINKNLYCSYGIIYGANDAQLEYVELLHPVKSSCSETVIECGIKIYKYVSEVRECDFTHTANIIFVQSFSAKTLEDYKNDKESVIVIGQIDNEGPIYEKTNVQVSINDRNETSLRMGADTIVMTEKDTTISSVGEIFRGMMWPYWTNNK